MNRLEQALVEVITKAVDGMEAATEFVVGEIPDVAQQALSFHLVWGSLEAAFGFLLLISTCVLLPRAYNKTKERCETEERNNLLWEYCSYGKKPVIGANFMLIGPVAFLAALTGFVGTFQGLYNVLKITLAPKLWLIEYAGSLT